MTNIQKKESIQYDHESRIVRLETVIENINDSLKEIKKDIKEGFKETREEMKDNANRINNRIWINFYWSIASFAALIGTMAHGFHWI